ncbi:MAG TPA: pyridoxamine 5'-phosphate oxidase family protein [Acidimicrobiia bacterium]|jgi:hypothetical protein|nr:pyridoxamine 5'-phosphate oxidase family protein [Acidimicrobiia bacterium]
MDASEVYLAKPPPDAIEQHLAKPINATVGTLNPDGSTHRAFVLFLWENDRFYFETASQTRKARNVAANPTALFAFEGVGLVAMAEGTARLIEGDEAHAINGRLRQKYLTKAAAETVDAALGNRRRCVDRNHTIPLAIVVQQGIGRVEQGSSTRSRSLRVVDRAQRLMRLEPRSTCRQSWQVSRSSLVHASATVPAISMSVDR